MINTSRTNLLNMIFSIREQLILIIQKRIEDPAVQALMIALTTGERDYFDPETYQQFISAGIVHILAVSGLHVGIIYGILILLTRPLSLTLPGQWIRCLIIILFFLFFAVITGLSPSVVRSIIMFTILLLGITFNRKSPTLNSVFLSAFLLLCYDPGWLWLVGFQLSYAAVLGIILFNPLIQSLIRTNSRILRGIWNLISVSLAAQLTTLPLSLLYFKQFPTYFLLSNLIAIPFAGVFLPGCIIFICTHYLNSLNALAANLLEHAGKYFMQAIQLIDHLPGSVIFPVNINRLDSILLFLLLVFLIQVLQYRKQRMIKYMFFVISFIILKDVLFYFSVSGQKKMLIYSISKLPVVELIDGHQTYLITQTSGSAYLDKVKYHTLNYHIHHNLNFRIVPIDRLFENLPCFISEDYTMIYWNKKSIILTTKKLDRQDSITLRESADFIISWRNEKLQVQIPGIETGNCDAGDFHPLRRLFRKKKLPQIRNENELISVRIFK